MTGAVRFGNGVGWCGKGTARLRRGARWSPILSWCVVAQCHVHERREGDSFGPILQICVESRNVAVSPLFIVLYTRWIRTVTFGFVRIRVGQTGTFLGTFFIGTIINRPVGASPSSPAQDASQPRSTLSWTPDQRVQGDHPVLKKYAWIPVSISKASRVPLVSSVRSRARLAANLVLTRHILVDSAC